jgi:hypothetical protein
MELQIKFFNIPLDGEEHDIRVHPDMRVVHAAIMPAPTLTGQDHPFDALIEKHMTVWCAVPLEDNFETLKCKVFTTGNVLDDDEWLHLGSTVHKGKAYHAFAKDEENKPKATTRTIEEVNLPEEV